MRPSKITANYHVPDSTPDVIEAARQARIKPVSLEVAILLGRGGNAGDNHVILLLTGHPYRKDGTPGARTTEIYMEYAPAPADRATPAPQWAQEIVRDILASIR